MAEEELHVVKLLDNYYRDSFGRVMFIIVGMVISIGMLAAISIYIYLNKPPPVTFRVASDWRVVAPVPIQEKYLSEADLLQWVSNVIPGSFDLSFLHMDEQLGSIKKYFTDAGYEIFLNQLNNYVDKTELQTNKMFSRGEPMAAPIIKRQGELAGRYAWWVEMPVSISYAGMRSMPTVEIKMNILVVRAETTNNLTGILIDNVIVEKIGIGTIPTGLGNR